MDKFIETLKKCSKIALPIAIILIIVITIICILKNGKSSTNSTASKGSAINIKQSNLDYNFSIKVNSMKDITLKEAFSDDTNYKVVNLTMDNKGKVPNPLYVQYFLVDSKGNELASASSLDHPISSNIDSNTNFDEEKLQNNNSTSGNLYFKTTSNDVKKLKIMVVTKGLQSTDNDVEYYYIEL